MLKKYNYSDHTKLYEQSEVIFEELSGGIYHIEKDRYGEFNDYVEYVSNKTVISYLETNGGIQTCVFGLVGAYANFKVEC